MTTTQELKKQIAGALTPAVQEDADIDASLQATKDFLNTLSPRVIPVPLPEMFDENFLLIGDTGSGKTRLAGTFPRPYFMDYDKGIRSLGRDFNSCTTIIEAPRGRSPRPGMYEYGKGWAAAMKRIDEIGRLMDKGNWPYDTFIHDSLTTLQDLALSAVLSEAAAKNRHKLGDPVDPGLWFGQMTLIQNLVSEMRGWPGLKIFTAHIQKDVNTVTQTVEKMALVTGKLAGKLPVFFDEIYFCECKTGSKGNEWVIRPHMDAVHRGARTRIGVEMYAVPDFKKSIWPHLIAP